MSKRGGTLIQRWRVPLGFLCGIAFVLLAKPNLLSLIMGGSVALIGLLVRAWAAGHIRKNAALAISGPYARTRNPLYLGSFILGLGFTIAGANVWLILLFAALFLGIYLPVMRIEARDVAALFPADYEHYAENVPLFVPRLTAWQPGDEQKSLHKFDFSLYLKYREYRAALGLLAAWSLLFVKFIKAAFF
ncbi:MAG: isoprenylcysteine carboxylmethyltransferase family protein [Pyrinomonadaceae bacterium]